MAMTEWLVVAIAGVFASVFLVGFAQKPVDRVQQLKRRFMALSFMTRGRGEAALMDRVEALRERYPGKPYVWYLEWLVNDLERAKR